MAAEIWKVSDSEYYGDSANTVSHSEMEDFRDSPALYEGRYLTKRWPRETTAALSFGSLFDACLFAPETVVTIPENVLAKNGSRRGEEWNKFVEANSGNVLMSRDDAVIVDEMLESLRSNPCSRRLLFDFPGESQVAIRFDCPETGIKRRCKLDRLVRSQGLIVDVKSAVSAAPKAFSHAAFNYGYHRQQDWYQGAVEEMTGSRWPFVFIVVQKSPPYTVRCIELDTEFADMARADNIEDLRAFAECKASGIWRDDDHGKIITLSAPQWAKYERHWVF